MTIALSYNCSLCGRMTKILTSAYKLKLQQKCYPQFQNIHKSSALRIGQAYYGTTVVKFGKYAI